MEISFIKLASYKGTESTGNISQLIGLQESLEGRPVVIIEDIIDTGRTLNRLIPELEKLKPSSIEVIALLFKPDALQAELNASRLDTIKENSSIRVVELTEEERDRFREASRPARKAYIRMAGERGAAILDQLLTMVSTTESAIPATDTTAQ